MIALYLLIDTILGIFVWLLIAQAVLSWLVAFGIVNTHNRAIYVIGDFLHRLTEPLLRPLRGIIPNFGGVDITPMVLILLVFFVRNLLAEYWPRY